MIKAGIIGSTGYAGQELVRILTQHKDVNITYISKQANIYMNIRDFQYQILYIIGKHPVNIHLGGFI